MKKLFALFLAFCMCVVFCACGNSEESNHDAELVELTKENISDYIHIGLETQNFDIETTFAYTSTIKYGKGTADCFISADTVVPCNLYNVKIELIVYSPYVDWVGEKIVTLYLSSNGSASKIISFKSEEGNTSFIREPLFVYDIKSVSGSVEI